MSKEKKKIGILTHYNVNNQGAQLQLFGLYNFLKENNFEPHVLTYDKNFDFVGNDIKKRNIITISSFSYIIKEFLLKKGLPLTYFNVKKYIKNKNFRKSNFKFKPYAISKMDYVLIGADEVLSLENGINMMMFGHCINSNNVIYYAPSCGKTEVEDYFKHNCDKLVKSGFETIKGLSARDSNTKNVIEYFTDKKEVPIVLDPALLYDFTNIIPTNNKLKRKYMIVYSYDKHLNSKEEIIEIKKFAKENKLEIISVGTYHKWCKKNISCDCIEWLSYFKNAEFVLTDTYHGTIASIINKRNCAVFVRKELNSNKLSYLLKQLKISEREIKEITATNLNKLYKNNINYNIVDKELKLLRISSKKYLSEQLGGELK